MKQRSFWMWAGLGALLAVSGSSAEAKNPSGEDRGVTISVYNDARVAEETVRQAEEEATRIFRQAGIAVSWLNCPSTPKPAEDATKSSACTLAVFLKHLQLRIGRRSIGLSPAIMGISYLSADGTGCYADLFYEHIEKLRERNYLGLAIILGHIAAHEIGHLLLGTNSHARRGLMRAVWEGEELASVSRGALFFSGSEANQMKERLAKTVVWRRGDPGGAAGQMGN
jgi:hypothetical protein